MVLAGEIKSVLDALPSEAFGAADAAHVSNLASSIVVGKLGTTPIEREELLAAVTHEFPNDIPVVS